MGPEPIVFKDGAAYEGYMGVWSRIAGDAFLDWLAPRPGLRWLDVGCGNGAFTERIVDRGLPASVHGIDPSEAQLEFARSRPKLRTAAFRNGDAMALPYPAGAFDAAVMPLVIFFLSDPAKGVAEMARVTAPGGLVTAYAWDMHGGGFPYAPLQEELQALGRKVPKPPSPEASRAETMAALWAAAGLEAVEARALTVERVFADFEDYWSTVQGGPSVAPTLGEMPRDEIETLRGRLRARLPADASGRLRLGARANAIRGRAGGKA